MSCGTETKSESPCCGPGKTDYYEVARKLVVSFGERLVSEMVEVAGADTIEIDAEDVSHSGSATSVAVTLQFSSDAVNWTAVNPVPSISFTAPGAKSGVVTGVTGKFVRLVVTIGIGLGSARITAGIRLRTEAPILGHEMGRRLPGIESSEPGVDRDYFLLADRLYVPLGSPVTLAPVSMADRNTVQLEVVIIEPTGIPVSADIEGSNDAQTWESLQSYSGLSFGYNSPAALTGISHRYVRVKVNGAQAFFNTIIELGLTLSRQS